MAQDLLEQAVYELSDAQARELIEVSATVLTRTEKKVLRAQIRLLSSLLEVHPECTEQVSQTVPGCLQVYAPGPSRRGPEAHQ